MKGLENFVDSMFAGFEDVQYVREVKEKIFKSLKEDYNKYMEEGASSDQALGRVIREFGNLNYVDWGLTPYIKEADLEKSRNQSKKYIKFSLVRTIAVVLFIASIALNDLLRSNYSIVLANSLSILMIVLGIGLFIYSKSIIKSKNLTNTRLTDNLVIAIWVLASVLYVYRGLTRGSWLVDSIIFLLAAGLTPLMEAFANQKSLNRKS